MATSERWKKVAGWPHSVSSEGRIRNDRTGRVLQPKKNRRGYLKVDLWEGGERRRRFVHHLVLEAFVGPRPDGLECNHKNGVKADNRPGNLEWVTHSENMRHATATGLQEPPPPLQGEAHPSSKLTADDVKSILRRLPPAQERAAWSLLQGLGEEFGVAPTTVHDIHAGIGWSHLQKGRPTKARQATGGVSNER